VRGVREALASREVRGVIFGHAGDANVHVNPLIDLRRSDWREHITGILDEVTALVASLGGTLTGEHGDGRIRTPLMDRVWTPDAMACFAEVKQALDRSGNSTAPGRGAGRAGPYRAAPRLFDVQTVTHRRLRSSRALVLRVAGENRVLADELSATLLRSRVVARSSDEPPYLPIFSTSRSPEFLTPNLISLAAR
jgi:hypothetical protein